MVQVHLLHIRHLISFFSHHKLSMNCQELLRMFLQFQSSTRVDIVKQLHQKQPL